MNIVLTVVGGIIGRMIITSLGSTLLAMNLPPDTVSHIEQIAQSLGPVGGPVLGLVAIAVAYGWSHWQKSRSGALTPK